MSILCCTSFSPRPSLVAFDWHVLFLILRTLLLREESVRIYKKKVKRKVHDVLLSFMLELEPPCVQTTICLPCRGCHLPKNKSVNRGQRPDIVGAHFIAEQRLVRQNGDGEKPVGTWDYYPYMDLHQTLCKISTNQPFAIYDTQVASNQYAQR